MARALAMRPKIMMFHEATSALDPEMMGEVLDVKVDEELVGHDGYPEVEKLKPLVYAPGNRLYYGIGKRLAKGFSVGKIK